MKAESCHAVELPMSCIYSSQRRFDLFNIYVYNILLRETIKGHAFKEQRLGNSGTFGLAFVADHVPVTRALMLVTISPRRHTFALLTTYSTVLHAPVRHSCLWAPSFAFPPTIHCQQHFQLMNTETNTKRRKMHGYTVYDYEPSPCHSSLP